MASSRCARRDLGYLLRGQILDAGVPKSGGDHGARRGSYPVRGEQQVVRGARAGQVVVKVGADDARERGATELLAVVVVQVVPVQGGEVDQLGGQLVVVLQGVNQLDRLDPQGQRLAQRQAQEFGVSHRQCVTVGGPVDEVVGQVGAALG